MNTLFGSDTSIATIRCTRCRRWLPKTEFHVRKSARNGLQYRCRECFKWHTVENRYGVTKEEYEAILESQEGRCAACGDPLPDRLDFDNRTAGGAHVDHRHDTNEVCGILCHGCNVALGALRDDWHRCRSLAAYAERTRGVR